MSRETLTCWYCPKCYDRTSYDTYSEILNGHWIEAYERHEEYCPGRPVEYDMIPTDYD